MGSLAHSTWGLMVSESSVAGCAKLLAVQDGKLDWWSQRGLCLTIEV